MNANPAPYTPETLCDIRNRVARGQDEVSLARWLQWDVDRLRSIARMHKIALPTDARQPPPHAVGAETKTPAPKPSRIGAAVRATAAAAELKHERRAAARIAKRKDAPIDTTLALTCDRELARFIRDDAKRRGIGVAALLRMVVTAVLHAELWDKMIEESQP